MKKKRAFIFVLLLLPNMIFAQGITTAVSGLIGTYISLTFPGLISAYTAVGAGLVGIVYAPQFEFAEDDKVEGGHEQNSTEKLKKYANKVSTYTCALVGLGAGLSTGWVGGNLAIELTKSAINLGEDSLMEIINYYF